MKISELVTLIIWAFGILNIVEPIPGMLGTIGVAVFWLLLIAHLVEISYFFNTLKHAKDGIIKGSLLTLLFGIFYIKSLET